MQLYSTTKKPLNERFTKIMKQRKKLKIFEEIEIQVNVQPLLKGLELLNYSKSMCISYYAGHLYI